MTGELSESLHPLNPQPSYHSCLQGAGVGTPGPWLTWALPQRACRMHTTMRDPVGDCADARCPASGVGSGVWG